MQVHFGIEALRPEWEAAVACVGTFDGVHLGHRAVICEAVSIASTREQPCVLVTFDRHPATILRPESQPKLIASLDENLRLFEFLGVAVAIVLTFDQTLSETGATEFLDRVLVGAIRAKALVLGHDFAFGRGREGTPEWLTKRIETHVVGAVEEGGRRVSSSAIRTAISEGRVEDASRWLGRPFEISAVVVPGQKLGKSLGFPTVNLARSIDQVVPADGVYAGRCETPHGVFRAAVSVGVRPAVGGGVRTIEAYLLDYPGKSLYGASVRLELLRRLREERDFESVDDLREQIRLDVERVAASV
ncbi:MAG: riboflavin biosynthesis protein RibF [Fimbriimonas ginsengisoli]|uniref:Riboflavin biosynthesis protein n=1 Tax=Fimbriimonas ginsengisoli TaxID=1005039 RepID=A0A931LU57_FIMGI|nr:riboflavin biosynthesis protein RibF [Fimbriimonas ginsengisoli]